MYSSYFTAHVPPRDCYFVIALLKSYDHLVFVRTLNVDQSILEFFVSPAQEPEFLEIMQGFVTKGMAVDVQKKPNRLISSDL